MKNKLYKTRSASLSRWLFFTSCMALCLFTVSVSAQFAVTTNSGSGLAPTYTSLAAAITALPATITSPVVITCPAGTETSPAGGYVISTVATAVNNVIIQGAGAVNSIISCSSGSYV